MVRVKTDVGQEGYKDGGGCSEAWEEGAENGGDHQRNMKRGKMEARGLKGQGGPERENFVQRSRNELMKGRMLCLFFCKLFSK